ncbi:MAG: hypothetical protein IBJ03_07785 [Gemmatimonadaceae bacterium]|nr:hypothetical protein [Gemmatimonadaceae bacterium]
MTQPPGSPETSGSSGPSEVDAAARQARILDDLQDAVQRLHVLAKAPRVVVASGTRAQGARPMAWQVLYERSLGPNHPAVVYRGGGSTTLPRALMHGFDSEPTLEAGWAVERLGDAMRAGPVIQVFRSDRLPDDVSRALVGVLVFEEDGLSLAGVKALVQELGVS